MQRGPKGEKRPGNVIRNPNKVAHIATIEVTGEFEGPPVTFSPPTEGGFGVKLAAAAMAVPHRPSRALARGGRSEDDGGTRPTRAQQTGL